MAIVAALARLAPEIILAVFAVVVVLLDLFVKKKGVLAGWSIAGILVSGLFSLGLWGVKPAALFNAVITVDNFSVFFNLLFLGIALLVILASVDYTNKMPHFVGEYHALILLAAIGMMLMAAATDLITIYLSIELTSLSLYALVGFLKDAKSTESALKYLLLGAVASAVMLYGMAMIFGFTGQTNLGDIARAIQGMSLPALLNSPALLLGIALLVAGFGFKIAAVPFQMWVPDVYEGAPTPITAYLSVGSKAAGFAVVLRVFYSAFALPVWLSVNWGLVFAALAVIGMTLGNVTAIPQSNIKRMLGYSSIAQAGYLLVGLAAVGLSVPGDTAGGSGILFFLASYTVTNLAAFIAIIAISNKLNSDLIDDYAGMGKRAPVLAAALTLAMVSLIGMPPGAGFMAKFYIFSGAVQHGLLWLVVIAVINSVISAYYYLRVVKVMWFGQAASEEKVPSSAALRLSLFLSCLGVLWLFFAPGAIISLAQFAARIFVG